MGTAAGEFVSSVVHHVGLATDAYHAALKSGPVTKLTRTAQAVWDATRLRLAKEMGLKWHAYNDLLEEYEARLARDEEIWHKLDVHEIFRSQRLIEAKRTLDKDRAIVAILKLGIQGLESQYRNLGLDSIRYVQFASDETPVGGTGIKAVGDAAMVEGSTVRGVARTGIEFDVALVGPALVKGIGKLGLRATAALLTRAGVKAGVREAAELAIINKEFVPIAERLLQNLTNQVNKELAADLTLAQKVLTKAEIDAAVNPFVARLNYGEAVERLVAQEIKDDPILKTLFEHVGKENGPVDFLGKGIFERSATRLCLKWRC